MALARAGILRSTRADVGIGVTGHISDPDPAGRNGVYIAVIFGSCTKSAKVEFPSRSERWKVKELVIEKTFQMVLELLRDGT